ncbi:MFS transporter [Streptomyces californicus]|uniref:MFS transporter n=1 Tax=Streptomyces californicus TaxID=67351 RepID=UPI00296FFCCD|nr:MFS transporter [Streptomyces californicus]MDW4918629.1 MFS transporter [Streptomyces californicus]
MTVVTERRSALRLRDFRLLIAGQFLSMITYGAYLAVLSWYAYQLTGSPGASGLVLGAAAVSEVTTLLLGGALADRWDRRSMMVVADAGRLVAVGALAVITAAGHTNLMVLTVCASLVSLFDGLFYPALGGIVPATVPAELIGSANATLGFVRSVSAIAGPALGGAVYASAGMATVLALTAFAFLVALGTALALRPLPREGPQVRSRPLRDIGEGARYVLSVPLLVSIPVAAVALLLSEGPTQTLLPRLVEEHFGGGAGTLSLLTTAYGAGAAAGALLYARLMPRRRRAVIVYTLWTTAHILCAAMALTTWLPGAVALAAVRGMCGGLGFALWETLLMHVVAPDKLSRVYSVNLFGTKALMPVGFALGGWLGAYLPAATVIACGQLTGAALMASLLLVRRIRAVQ